MYCNYCGKVIQDDANHCAYCGTRVGGVMARKKLIRPRVGRKIAGVCAGFAEYLDLDVTVVRCLLVPGHERVRRGSRVGVEHVAVPAAQETIVHVLGDLARGKCERVQPALVELRRVVLPPGVFLPADRTPALMKLHACSGL